MVELLKRDVKTIRLMKIEFGGDIGIDEIPSFRGAIIKRAQGASVLFHNHLGEDKFLYVYPKIQYKNLKGSPTIICLEEGVDQIHHIFQADDFIRIGENEFFLELKQVDVKKIRLQTWDSAIDYKISNWLPLNQRNYSEYQGLKLEKDRISFLERILIGNILSFAKGINWSIRDRLNLRIKRIDGPYPRRFKNETWLSFTAVFCVNVSLPQNIGLGKGVSHGFGNIRFASQKSNENE
jgi:hypothetical protein